MAKRARITRIDITTFQDSSPQTIDSLGWDEQLDEAKAQAAYDRAIAWARSPKGTAYGSSIPKTEVDR